VTAAGTSLGAGTDAGGPGAPGLVRTLPGRGYTDPGVFAAEQRRILEATWFAAAPVADLAGPGAFRTVTVGAESVLLVRDRSGALGGFLNVCRHRGARLCTEPAGRLRNAVRCPYHAWTYRLDGSLLAAPNLEAIGEADRPALGLRRVHLREWLGQAWVCLAEQPPSFEDTVVGAVAGRLGGPSVVDAWQVDRLALGRRITYDVAANWKLIVENFMECYHCATIHPELTEVLPEFAGGYAAQYWVGHGAEFAEGARGFTVDGRAGFGVLPGVEAHDRRYYAVTVNPQVFVNLVPDHVVLHRMYPMAADRTVVECDWLYDPDVLAAGADVSASVELFDRVNRQDFDACERCQPAMSSRGYADGGVLVPTEHHIAGFHDWVRALLA
jgi:glycine betaine catabolism A